MSIIVFCTIISTNVSNYITPKKRRLNHSHLYATERIHSRMQIILCTSVHEPFLLQKMRIETPTQHFLIHDFLHGSSDHSRPDATTRSNKTNKNNNYRAFCYRGWLGNPLSTCLCTLSSKLQSVWCDEDHLIWNKIEPFVIKTTHSLSCRMWAVSIMRLFFYSWSYM